MCGVTTTLEKLEEFGSKLGLRLQTRGEVGFGRPCVGFLDARDHYVDINPWREVRDPGLESFAPVWPEDARLCAPTDVPDAYHKHSCLCVLAHGENYDEALRQLLTWVEHLKSQGDLYVDSYATGASGIHAAFEGSTGYGIRILERR